LNKSAKTTGTAKETLIFGGGSGTFRKRPAHPALRQHFSSVWFHTVPRDATGRSVIVPDGCADIVWCNGTLRFGGPDRQAKLEPVPPGTCVVGMQFQPGAAYHWLRTPVSDVVGSRSPLEFFWGNEARRLSDWVAESQHHDEIAQRIEIGFIDRLNTLPLVDAFAQTLFRAVRNRHDYSVPVTEQLMAKFGLSERTLRRRFNLAFGFGPKMLDRILRLQRFVALARLPGDGALADLASAVGYADQAHLAREARILAGMTPTEMRERIAGPPTPASSAVLSS
jgi:AraC-like DNA-binding protein